MQAAHAGTYPSGQPVTFIDRLNGEWHEPALASFMVIVLAHWAEHLTQAFQIYALGWPVPESRGVLGHFFPWLIKSETLHYGYALVMLVGLFALRQGFTGIARAAVVDDRARDPVLSPHRARAPADPGAHRAATSSIVPCRRASCSSGSRASNCTSSTTPSCSSRW